MVTVMQARDPIGNASGQVTSGKSSFCPRFPASLAAIALTARDHYDPNCSALHPLARIPVFRRTRQRPTRPTCFLPPLIARGRTLRLKAYAVAASGDVAVRVMSTAVRENGQPRLLLM